MRQVGDAANDAQRIDAESIRAQVVGEGANLGLTQAARIAFAANGGRINTDFIDNSAGVDCSDNEVNIKIALASDVGKPGFDMPARNTLLASMTDAVAHLVLEDNRLQTLALSIAQREGANAIPSLVRLIGTFEAAGRLDRAVEGLPGDELLKRRAQDGRGMTRPELAVLLATAKLGLQEAIEDHPLASDDGMAGELLAAFPPAMQDSHRDAILSHRLRPQIVATKLANRIVNRLGLVHPFELAEEEGASMGDIAFAFVAAERLFGLRETWNAIDAASLTEDARLTLFEQIAAETRAQMADLLRAGHGHDGVDAAVAALRPGVTTLDAAVGELLRDESRAQADSFRPVAERCRCDRGASRPRGPPRRDGRGGRSRGARRKCACRCARADPRLHPAGCGARAGLGAGYGDAAGADRSVGTPADRGTRARFPADAARLAPPRCDGTRSACREMA